MPHRTAYRLSVALLLLLVLLPAVPVRAQSLLTNAEYQQRWEVALENLKAGHFVRAANGFIALGRDCPARSEAQYTCWYNAACAWARQGNREHGTIWLARAIKAGFRDGLHIAADEDLAAIRDEPLYGRLMRMIADRESFAQLDDLDIGHLQWFHYVRGRLTDEQRAELAALRAGMEEEVNEQLQAAYARLMAEVDRLIAEREAELARPGRAGEPWLGATVRPLNPMMAMELGIAAGLMVTGMVAEGPADAAGLQPGDVLMALGDTVLATSESLGEVLAAHRPGETVAFRVLRGGENQREMYVELGDQQRRTPAREGGWLGVRLEGTDDGLVVHRVEPDSPAAVAGLRVGDRITKIDGEAMRATEALVELLKERYIGDTLRLVVVNGESRREAALTIGEQR